MSARPTVSVRIVSGALAGVQDFDVRDLADDVAGS
jgi:hypothetical protein